MGLFSGIRRLFTRSNAMDERFWAPIMSESSSSGISVTPDTATRSAAVYSCVTVLAESIAALPLLVYRRNGKSKERDNGHPIYKLLHDKPNRWQTGFEFREMMMGHVLLRGNAYALKVYGRRGSVSELVPLNPTRVTPKMTPDGDVVYEFRPLRGGIEIYDMADVFHVKGYSPDGLVGTSPIAHAREAVGLSLVAEEFGARTFANDAQPGGVLEHPGSLGEKALANLRQSVQDLHGGVRNARKWIILENGMKWSKIGMSSDETQWLETRKFQIEEIARIFRVPPHLIGHLERATYSNIEHQSLNFVQHTLLPWFKRWEQAIHERLLNESERETHFVEFLADGLLRADISSRYAAYAIARQWGWMSADDVRRLENMDPLPEEQGEVYLLPMNMVDASRLDEVIDSQVKQKDTAQVLNPANDPPSQPLNNQSNRDDTGIFEAFQPVISHLIARYDERIEKSKKAFSTHRDVISAGLTPVVEGIYHLMPIKSPEPRAKIVIRSFLNYWEANQGETFENRLSNFIQTIGEMAEIRVMSARSDASPTVNLTVECPPVEPRKPMKVSWITNKEGQREAILKEVNDD